MNIKSIIQSELIDARQLAEMAKDHPLMGPNMAAKVEELEDELKAMNTLGIEGDPTWNADALRVFWADYDYEYVYSLSGPGYSISPTRTPWASWWRPQKGVVWALAWRDKGEAVTRNVDYTTMTETYDRHKEGNPNNIPPSGSIYCGLYHRSEKHISGPGFEISPTRTPWASWWRPQKGVVWALAWRDKGNRIPLLEFQCYGIPTYMAWAGLEPCQQYEWHDTFHGPCECSATHHLPDVAKESPQ